MTTEAGVDLGTEGDLGAGEENRTGLEKEGLEKETGSRREEETSPMKEEKEEEAGDKAGTRGELLLRKREMLLQFQVGYLKSLKERMKCILLINNMMMFLSMTRILLKMNERVYNL